MEVSGRLHTPVALPAGKETRTHPHMVEHFECLVPLGQWSVISCDKWRS